MSVQLVDQIESVVLDLGRDAFGCGDIENRVLSFAKLDPGVGGWEEAGGPKRGATGEAAAGGHDDKGGEVVGFRAESIERPGAEAGATGLGEAGVEKELGRSVIKLVGGAGLDDAELVGDGS